MGEGPLSLQYISTLVCVREKVKIPPRLKRLLIPPKYTWSKGVTSKFGSRGGKWGEINGPRGIAALPNGQIVVSEKRNHRLQFFSPNGTSLSSAGSPLGRAGTQATEFDGPTDVVYDEHRDQLLVCDFGNQRIKVLTREGKFITQIKVGVSRPCGVCRDREGTLFVTHLKRISVFDSSGRQQAPITSTRFQSLQQIRYYEERLYVVDWRSNMVHVLAPKSCGRYVRRRGGLGEGELTGPVGLSIDSAGNLLVGEMEGKRITVMSRSGEVIRRLGEGELWAIPAVVVTREDEVFACDFTEDKIVCFN